MATFGELLFLRITPRGLINRGPNRLAAALAPEGVRGRLGTRSITIFWIGMGRRVRVPGPQLLERIRGGAITEIVDIGCAGALDPSLRRGDLVLSSDEVAFDGTASPRVRRVPAVHSILQGVAADRGVSLRRAPVLTHERFVASREERIELFDRTGCVAVQMEHAWFLQLLRSMTAAECFQKIRFTHLVLITDAVPRTTATTATVGSAWDALVAYALPIGGGGVMSLRREVLSGWPPR